MRLSHPAPPSPAARAQNRISRKSRTNQNANLKASREEIMEALVLLREQIPEAQPEHGENQLHAEAVIWAAVKHIRQLQKALLMRRLERLQRAAQAEAARANVNDERDELALDRV